MFAFHLSTVQKMNHTPSQQWKTGDRKILNNSKDPSYGVVIIIFTC